MDSKSKKSCISCGQQSPGKFCCYCGEKVITKNKDFSLKHFLEETLEGFTHLDSKLFKSFYLLVFNPGFLSLENVNGVRVKYMKPIQIFIIISLFFFAFYSSATAFFSNPMDLIRAYKADFNYANIFNYNLEEAVNQKALQLSITDKEVFNKLRSEAAHKSKAFLLLLIPVYGAFQFLLFRKKYSYYAQHLIFATHSVSFFILLDLLFITCFKILRYDSVGDNEIFIMLAVFFVHLYFSIKKFYTYSWIGSFARSVFSFLAFIIVLVIYRQLITIYTVIQLE